MKLLVHHEEFKRLNVAFALDEGIASPKNALKVFYGERMPWWIKITATGPTGHGSQFIKDTAPTKLLKVIEKFMNLRNEQEKLLEVGLHHNGQRYTLGDVTTINLTFLQVCFVAVIFALTGKGTVQLLMKLHADLHIVLLLYDGVERYSVQRYSYGGDLWFRYPCQPLL